MTEKWFERSQMYQELASESLEKQRYDFSCYSAQQAVDFYLKGLLIQITGARPYSHSLTTLLRALAGTGIEVPPRVTECARALSEHYLQARDPDARLNDYTREEAAEAIRRMEVMIDFLRKVRPPTP